jgi:hypothetical protein
MFVSIGCDEVPVVFINDPVVYDLIPVQPTEGDTEPEPERTLAPKPRLVLIVVCSMKLPDSGVMNELQLTTQVLVDLKLRADRDSEIQIAVQDVNALSK